MSENQKVKLVFAEPAEGTPERQYNDAARDEIQPVEVDLDRLIDSFKGFKIDTIELSCSGAIESGGLTQLFVSAKGEAGVTVILKPEKG